MPDDSQSNRERAVGTRKAHYETTGCEILAQTKASVTHFVAGLGTGGTFRGVGARLRRGRPGVKLIAVQPDGPFHGLEGLKHMASAIVPGIYDPNMADETIFVRTEAAEEMVRRVEEDQHMQIGASAGANLVASLRVAERIMKRVQSATIVTVIPDREDREDNRGME